MRFHGQILRLLLIVGLIPAVLAAGLPMSACACDAVSATTGCACCESEAVSCCGDEEASCPCCDSVESRSCCDQRDGADAEPTIDCHCGVSIPVPAAPSPPSTELTFGMGLPVASLDAVAPAPIVPQSAKRTRSALLAPADLPTTLCTLLI